MGSEEQPPDGEAERDYESSQSVDYRGDFKPELVQLLSRLRSQGEAGDGEGSGDPITQEMLEELLQNSAELDMAADQSETRNVSGTFADNLLKRGGAEPAQDTGVRAGAPHPSRRAGGLAGAIRAAVVRI